MFETVYYQALCINGQTIPLTTLAFDFLKEQWRKCDVLSQISLQWNSYHKHEDQLESGREFHLESFAVIMIHLGLTAISHHFISSGAPRRRTVRLSKNVFDLAWKKST